MNNIFKFLLLIFINIISFRSFAYIVDVQIYTNEKIKSAALTIVSGKFEVYNNTNNTKICELNLNNSIDIKVEGSKIRIRKNNKSLGTFINIKIIGNGFMNSLKIQPNSNKLIERTYDDGIYIINKNGQLNLINHVQLEHYIAGVVEAEGGIKKNIEFYKVQSIICRTYAINNLQKHKSEGYNLCDQVHCQVFKGRCKNSDIMMAASLTSGDVIIDKDKNLILAAFHSNCGGQTVNSEDVWSKPIDYLKSVNDTFCYNQNHARWTKSIALKDWKNYLFSKYKFPVNDSLLMNKALNIEQIKRDIYFLGDTSLNLKIIRNDFGFNSTFFSTSIKGDSLVFSGKGFGHGIGLCQEGAMRMVDLGYNYNKIIKFYYKDVEIVNFEELNKK